MTNETKKAIDNVSTELVKHDIEQKLKNVGRGHEDIKTLINTSHGKYNETEQLIVDTAFGVYAHVIKEADYNPNYTVTEIGNRLEFEATALREDEIKSVCGFVANQNEDFDEVAGFGQAKVHYDITCNDYALEHIIDGSAEFDSSGNVAFGANLPAFKLRDENAEVVEEIDFANFNSSDSSASYVAEMSLGWSEHDLNVDMF